MLTDQHIKEEQNDRVAAGFYCSICFPLLSKIQIMQVIKPCFQPEVLNAHPFQRGSLMSNA